MEITVLASGSKGNCTLVRGGDGALLVDCGLSAREGLSRLSTPGSKMRLSKGSLSPMSTWIISGGYGLLPGN